MRNVIQMLIIAVSTMAGAERAVAAVDMEGLEVTIRVIENAKEHTGDVGHKLELPAPPAKTGEDQGREVRDHDGGGKGLERRGRDENRGNDRNEAHNEADDHHRDAKENHDGAVEQYQDSKEERNKAWENREDLKEMLHNGDHENIGGEEGGSIDN